MGFEVEGVHVLRKIFGGKKVAADQANQTASAGGVLEGKQASEAQPARRRSIDGGVAQAAAGTGPLGPKAVKALKEAHEADKKDLQKEVLDRCSMDSSKPLTQSQKARLESLAGKVQSWMDSPGSVEDKAAIFYVQKGMELTIFNMHMPGKIHPAALGAVVLGVLRSRHLTDAQKREMLHGDPALEGLASLRHESDKEWAAPVAAEIARLWGPTAAPQEALQTAADSDRRDALAAARLI